MPFPLAQLWSAIERCVCQAFQGPAEAMTQSMSEYSVLRYCVDCAGVLCCTCCAQPKVRGFCRGKEQERQSFPPKNWRSQLSIFNVERVKSKRSRHQVLPPFPPGGLKSIFKQYAVCEKNLLRCPPPPTLFRQSFFSILACQLRGS